MKVWLILVGFIMYLLFSFVRYVTDDSSRYLIAVLWSCVTEISTRRLAINAEFLLAFYKSRIVEPCSDCLKDTLRYSENHTCIPNCNEVFLYNYNVWMKKIIVVGDTWSQDSNQISARVISDISNKWKQ
jgi:hypothetical protein